MGLIGKVAGKAVAAGADAITEDIIGFTIEFFRALVEGKSAKEAACDAVDKTALFDFANKSVEAIQDQMDETHTGEYKYILSDNYGKRPFDRGGCRSALGNDYRRLPNNEMVCNLEAMLEKLLLKGRKQFSLLVAAREKKARIVARNSTNPWVNQYTWHTQYAAQLDSTLAAIKKIRDQLNGTPYCQKFAKPIPNISNITIVQPVKETGTTVPSTLHEMVLPTGYNFIRITAVGTGSSGQSGKRGGSSGCCILNYVIPLTPHIRKIQLSMNGAEFPGRDRATEADGGDLIVDFTDAIGESIIKWTVPGGNRGSQASFANSGSIDDTGDFGGIAAGYQGPSPPSNNVVNWGNIWESQRESVGGARNWGIYQSGANSSTGAEGGPASAFALPEVLTQDSLQIGRLPFHTEVEGNAEIYGHLNGNKRGKGAGGANSANAINSGSRWFFAYKLLSLTN